MFKINGGVELHGEINIGGSKNAVLPIIAASLLLKGEITLNNVPHIGDVWTFLEILNGIGIKSIFNNNTLKIDATNIIASKFNLEKIKKIRASILLLGPLLERIGEISIPTPGGCNLGKRSIEDHLNGLEKIGYDYILEDDRIKLKGKSKKGNIDINAGFGVTTTENIIIASVLRKGETIIKSAAIEPHVMNLIDFLRTAGADIKIKYNHTILINGVSNLKHNFEFDIISDYIQSGSYMIIGALCAKDFITIHNARLDDLYVFIEKLKEAGIKIEDLGNDTVKIYKAEKLYPVNIQTNIFPGFPTDLQSPFAILMTRSNGESKIHEVLFEGRLNWLIELDKMGGNTKILNPHQAVICGNSKTKLKGAKVTSWDLRAGFAMIISALIANGETTVTNIEYIKRGYEDLVKNLKKLGADIKEIE